MYNIIAMLQAALVHTEKNMLGNESGILQRAIRDLSTITHIDLTQVPNMPFVAVDPSDPLTGEQTTESQNRLRPAPLGVTGFGGLNTPGQTAGVVGPDTPEPLRGQLAHEKADEGDPTPLDEVRPVPQHVNEPEEIHVDPAHPYI